MHFNIWLSREACNFSEFNLITSALFFKMYCFVSVYFHVILCFYVCAYIFLVNICNINTNWSIQIEFFLVLWCILTNIFYFSSTICIKFICRINIKQCWKAVLVFNVTYIFLSNKIILKRYLKVEYYCSFNR